MKNSFTRATLSVHRYAFLTSLVATAGCGSAPDGSTDPGRSSEESPTGSAREDIINGTVSAGAETQGMVFINGSCSGTLIRNDTVLTARHCVTTDGTISGTVDTTGSDFSVTMGSQTRTAATVVAPASPDVALLTFNQFFTMSGSRYGFRRNIYGGTDASLLNNTLACYGYGLNTFTDGAGTLRTAQLTVASTSTSALTFLPNSSGQIQWHGDSGGTCFYGSSMAGVASTASWSGTTVTSATLVGPEAFQSWVASQQRARADASIYVSTSATAILDWMTIDHPDSNGNASALVTVTPNFNPGGSISGYLNHNLGVWYTGSKWAVFNEDAATMPTGPAFNVSIGGATTVHTATAANIFGQSTMLDIPAINGNPWAIVIVTQNWNVSSVYNNHPVGVWYYPPFGRWFVYNEDLATMPVGAGFNVRVVTNADGAFVHFADSTNTAGDFTYLNDANLNGQPWARVFVTHNYDPGGNGSTYLSHPIGVWYDASAQKWAVFNEDLATMPSTVAFNVMVRP